MLCYIHKYSRVLRKMSKQRAAYLLYITTVPMVFQCTVVSQFLVSITHTLHTAHSPDEVLKTVDVYMHVMSYQS